MNVAGHLVPHSLRRAASRAAMGAGAPRTGRGCRALASGGSNWYKHMYKRSIEDTNQFWSEQGREHVQWIQPFLDNKAPCDLEAGMIEFYSGGKLNASVNCVDRHVHAGRGEDIALIWEKDGIGESERITYRELEREVCRLANVLKNLKVRKGDVVTLYMPICPHAVYAMLACARIGAVHSVVFAGFSAEALAQRVVDAQSQVIITADQLLRGGKKVGLKRIVDSAIDKLPDPGLVETVLVLERTGAIGTPEARMHEGRDIHLQERMALQRPVCPAEVMDAEDTLFRLYTSGSTGTPKGIEHATGGYLVYAAMTHRHVFDLQPGDVYACVADIGWITGHSYVVYGPLANGATTTLFESVPTYPDPGRYWEMVERLGVTQFYTSPTAIRLLMQFSDDFVTRYDRSSLRVLGSVGEPINPEAWKWYHELVGEKRCSIVDTWWQTETGGIMMTPLPGDTDAIPGFAMRPFFGVEPVLLDTVTGEEIAGNDVAGLLALKSATPGMGRTIANNFVRYMDTYWRPYPGYYFTGDGARRDADGNYVITGRVDDVINVSGHRVGTAEIEAALGSSTEDSEELVTEAAVVGYPHEIKGEAIYAFVILKSGASSASKEELAAIRKLVRDQIGGFAAPDVIQVVQGLPKTRSGKIMRRVLRKIANGDYDDLGDLSTLADPYVVDAIMRHAHNKRPSLSF